jgi:NAD(P)-dependent dehydrogenase (short-subunit alcohol dehydrogenase family)
VKRQQFPHARAAGSTAGIGYAIALQLAKDGAKTYVSTKMQAAKQVS